MRGIKRKGGKGLRSTDPKQNQTRSQKLQNASHVYLFSSKINKSI